MNKARIPEVEKVMGEEILPDAFDFLVKVGNIPYKANRRAMVELDLNRNTQKGLKKAQEAIDGINGWIGELELFRDASERVAKQAVAVLRAP
jgi:hypothetical protein